MKYTENFSIMSHDIGHNFLARPSIVWRYMQETANHQMRDEKPSYTELLERGQSFMLSRMNMLIYKPLKQYDKITVETWACEGKGVSFDRAYRILRDGEVAAEGFAVWALVDVKDRHLLRHSDVELNYSTDATPDGNITGRFRFPAGAELENVGERVIRYSDIDCNRHMNNTNYPDMICDFIDGIDSLTVKSMSICFISEAPYGSTVTVKRCRDCATEENGDETMYFETFVEDKTNIRARVTVGKSE